MKIQVNSAVDSKSYQSHIFTIISKDEVIKNLYNAMNDNNQHFTIYDLKGDWTLIGITARYAPKTIYSTDFKII